MVDLANREAPRHNDPLASSFAASSAGVIAFIAVANEGSFAKAADRLGVGRSAVSRSVQRLEEQLAARLFLRTTRSTTLTHEGDLFYSHCQPAVEQIVQALDEMRELRSGPPGGHLRISSGVSFGRNVVAPLLGGFKALYPDISLDLSLDDGPSEGSSNRMDVAFRDGPLLQTQMIAKRLMPMQMLVCASPEYVRTHGLPNSVDEVDRHRCINYRLASGRISEWVFKSGGELRRFAPSAMHTFNDSCLVREAVLEGRGIAQLPRYQICRHLRDGELLSCLPQDLPDDHGHYICFQSRQHLPTRVRVFIDYMTDRVRELDLQCNRKAVAVDEGGLEMEGRESVLPPMRSPFDRQLMRMTA